MKWQILRHNGVAFPPAYAARGLTVRIQGKPVKLAALPEEILMAWAKKKDTPYVLDPVFQRNFLDDLKKALPGDYALADIDFTPLNQIADREKTANLSDAEKKQRAAERKAERDELKAKFGAAQVDEHTVDVGAYLVEPPGILMGRGNHPLRGKWKPRVRDQDVILNLDEDAPVPPGHWKKIVHQHDALWIASWWDELSKKQKYIWLAETSHLRQERDQEKYVKAQKLEGGLARVREKIQAGMQFSDQARAAIERDEKKLREETLATSARMNEAKQVGDTAGLKKAEEQLALLKQAEEAIAKQREKIEKRETQRRQIATVCYLIDRLAMRVGDEKDEDEADTVGASTLRVEHVRVTPDRIEFDFLGKDSVQWQKTLPLAAREQTLARNLQDFMRGKQPGDQIFDRIDSTHVNRFLGEVMDGLTAKVFRTYHATTTVRDALAQHTQFAADASPFAKEHAARLANLAAAIQCNHKRTPPKNWEESLKKRETEIERLRAKKPDVSKLQSQIAPREKSLEKLLAAKPDPHQLAAQVKAREETLRHARQAQAALPQLDETIQARQAALEKLIAEQKKAETEAQAAFKKKQAALAAVEKQKPPKAKKALARYNKRVRAARRAVTEMKKTNDGKLKRLKDRAANARRSLEAATKVKRAKTRGVTQRVAQAAAALKRAQAALAKEPARYAERLAKARAALELARRAPEKARRDYRDRVEKATQTYELAKQTRDYNLGTSLKNYIDPRVYKAWGDHVGYDWRRMYTQALQRKFMWVEQARVKWNNP